MTSVTETAVGTRRHLRVPPAVRLRTRTALAALVGALVVGILGMHALATHGTPAPVTAAASTAATSTALPGMSSQDAAMRPGTSHDRHDHAAAAAGSPASTGHGTGHGTHDMTSMVMLCVVMLAAAALTLLILLAVRTLRPLLPAAFLPAAVREQVLQWVRGTGPPPVWQFSVIRC